MLHQVATNSNVLCTKKYVRELIKYNNESNADPVIKTRDRRLGQEGIIETTFARTALRRDVAMKQCNLHYSHVDASAVVSLSRLGRVAFSAVERSSADSVLLNTYSFGAQLAELVSFSTANDYVQSQSKLKK
jgi:hypothetical protein